MIARILVRRNRAPYARTLGALIALALAAGWSALSAAQSSAATNAPTTAPAPMAATAGPAGTPTQTSGSIAAPDAPQKPSGTPSPVSDAGSNPSVASASIALVLPLESESFARVADAVKAGFLAAAAAAQVTPLVIGHGDGEVLTAFAKAKASGARVLVGPLVRDDVRALVAAETELPLTLALNQLDEDTVLPAYLYTLALTVESDARQLARRARSDGAQSVVVIASDAPLQKRFASAFNAEWILAGGGPPSMVRYDRSLEALALLKRNLAKAPPDAAVLALDSADAALAKPYLGNLAVYAGSQINDRQPSEVRRDLDDLRFVDIPWLAEPDAPRFAGLPHPNLANAMLDRLYALGIDAFRLARALEDGPRSKLELDGATGHIALDASHQFVREGRLLQFRAGEIVPLDGH